MRTSPPQPPPQSAHLPSSPSLPTSPSLVHVLSTQRVSELRSLRCFPPPRAQPLGAPPACVAVRAPPQCFNPPPAHRLDASSVKERAGQRCEVSTLTQP